MDTWEIQLVKDEERMAVLSEISTVMRQCLEMGLDLRAFGVLFVDKFCTPTMARSASNIKNMAQAIGNYATRN